MRVEHVINMMKERHGLKITPCTLARCSHDLGLHQRQDDIDLGRVTMDEEADMIQHCKHMPDGQLAGYWRVHHILRNQHGVHVHQVLFLYLSVPLVQDCLDKWTDDYNTYSKRANSQSMLPGGCSPNLCCYAPASKDGVKGLIPIPAAHVEELKAQKYPSADELMATSPLWLREMCIAAAQALDIDLTKITVDNVWTIFRRLLDFMRSYNFFLLGTPNEVQRTPTNLEQALATIVIKNLTFPNGILLYQDRLILIISTLTPKQLSFYQLQSLPHSNPLIKFDYLTSHSLKFGPDNLSIDKEDCLIISGHPSAPKIFLYVFNPNRFLNSPSRITYLNLGTGSENEVRSLFEDDGEFFMSSSTGLIVRDANQDNQFKLINLKDLVFSFHIGYQLLTSTK
ncbi:hypothetical protein DFH28DRAFT_1182465 [Melampsora americana]|nr:hypothetical protein DFH28DRAFT_1182465 [Melampsora americana]